MRHIREMEEAGITKLDVTEEFLIGRVIAENVVDKDSGEIIANANDEITEARCKNCWPPASRRSIRFIPTIWTMARSSRRPCAPMRLSISGRRAWRSTA